MKLPMSIALCSILVAGCTASLRPGSLAGPPTASEQAQGRAMLEKAARVHGDEAAANAGHIQFVMTDQWQGLMGKIGNPWPDSKVHARVDYKLGTFDSRATFLDGDLKGGAWGMQSWRTYEVSPDGETSFEDNDDARFILAALQYLFEFPFRAKQAELVAYAGKEMVNGHEYDIVFITWGSFDAHTEHDQYVAYIEPATGRIEKVSHTVRTFARFATGVTHYSNYRDFDGISVPLRLTITDKVDDDLDDFLHQVNIDAGSVRVGGEPLGQVVAHKPPGVAQSKPYEIAASPRKLDAAERKNHE